MKNVVQIEQMSVEELTKIIKSAITPPVDPHHDILLNSTVDRAFIKRNLNLSHRQILRYEELGVISPARLNPTEHSSIIYTIQDYLNLIKHLKL